MVTGPEIGNYLPVIGTSSAAWIARMLLQRWSRTPIAALYRQLSVAWRQGAWRRAPGIVAVATLQRASHQPGGRRPHRTAPLVPAPDAFFLHVETEAAPQHVGGMVLLGTAAAGQPTLAEVRELVRDEIAKLPRFRRRLQRSASWRRWRWVEVDPDQIDYEWHVTERVAPATRMRPVR